MDVKPGHCWRCEKALPDCVVRCDRCNKAVYCSNLCQKRDLVRHGAVECQIFGPKTCTYCKKEGDHKQVHEYLIDVKFASGLGILFGFTTLPPMCVSSVYSVWL